MITAEPSPVPLLAQTGGRIQKARVLAGACREHGIVLATQIAYVLATADWETGGTLDPVREAFHLGGKADEYRRRLPYYPYYGRGYVQLTWRPNYRKFGELLGVDLLRDPDLALEPGRAAWILAYGFKHGSFTGRRLSDFVNPARCDFRSARRCINGLDRAQTIADMAKSWLNCIDLVAEGAGHA